MMVVAGQMTQMHSYSPSRLALSHSLHTHFIKTGLERHRQLLQLWFQIHWETALQFIALGYFCQRKLYYVAIEMIGSLKDPKL